MNATRRRGDPGGGGGGEGAVGRDCLLKFIASERRASAGGEGVVFFAYVFVVLLLPALMIRGEAMIISPTLSVSCANVQSKTTFPPRRHSEFVTAK